MSSSRAQNTKEALEEVRKEMNWTLGGLTELEKNIIQLGSGM